MHGARFGVVGRETPVALGRFRVQALAPEAALLDEGLAWLFAMLAAQGRHDGGLGAPA
jgi:hypothetical protein